MRQNQEHLQGQEQKEKLGNEQLGQEELGREGQISREEVSFDEQPLEKEKGLETEKESGPERSDRRL
jgi:hypothetical protein